MINAKEAHEIYSKTINKEIEAVEIYLQNYVYNIVDNRIKTAAEMGRTECQIPISVILSQIGDVSENYKKITINTLIETLKHQNFIVINPERGSIIISWYNPQLM
jgi:hypothetical protein